MGEAGQRYAKPDAVPAVALRTLIHTLICNHISCTDGRHVRKAEECLLAVCVVISICFGLYFLLSFGVYHITVMTVYLSRCEIQKNGENSSIIQVLNKPSSDFGLVENQMKMS